MEATKKTMLTTTKIKITDFQIAITSIKTTNMILTKITGDITTNHTLNPWAHTNPLLRIHKT